jgi:hypothetical protein
MSVIAVENVDVMVVVAGLGYAHVRCLWMLLLDDLDRNLLLFTRFQIWEFCDSSALAILEKLEASLI